MKIKFGSVIVGGSGKIGGHVATTNRSGAVLRTKVTPSNAQTIRQSAVRNLFSTLAQAWRSLTQDQRDAWNAAVAGYQRTDIFGDNRTPSGINLFQRLNNVIMNTGGAMITDPPLPGSVPEITISAFTAAVGTPAMSVSFNGPVATDSSVIVFATAPLRACRAYVKSDFRQIAVLAAAETSPYNALVDYTAKFGSTGQVGQKIFIKLISVNNLTGQVSTGSVASVITVA